MAYICSRYYRAPELIFGATNYNTAVDVWSLGCVVAEMLLGEPLFPGENAGDQLVEIIKVLGTPTREQVLAMNPTYTEQRLTPVKAHPWSKVFRARTPPEAIDFVARFLQYVPERRMKPLEALDHPFLPNCLTRQRDCRISHCRRCLSSRLRVAINPELVQGLMNRSSAVTTARSDRAGVGSGDGYGSGPTGVSVAASHPSVGTEMDGLNLHRRHEAKRSLEIHEFWEHWVY